MTLGRCGECVHYVKRQDALKKGLAKKIPLHHGWCTRHKIPAVARSYWCEDKARDAELETIRQRHQALMELEAEMAGRSCE